MTENCTFSPEGLLGSPISLREKSACLLCRLLSVIGHFDVFAELKMHVNDDKHVHMLTAAEKFMHCVEVLCLKLYLSYVRFS